MVVVLLLSSDICMSCVRSADCFSVILSILHLLLQCALSNCGRFFIDVHSYMYMTTRKQSGSIIFVIGFIVHVKTDYYITLFAFGLNVFRPYD